MRTSKTTSGATTTFLVDKNQRYAQVLLETTGSAIVTYTYGHGLISQTRPGTGTRFYQYDGQFSTRQLTSTTAVVTDTYSYDAFGVLLSSTGSSPNVYLYAGEQLDPNVGFYYLRARYYNPVQGRFITTDPEEGNIFDPVSLHRYLYANANPVNNRDPSGRETFANVITTLTIANIILTTGGFIAAAAGQEELATVLFNTALVLGAVEFALVGGSEIAIVGYQIQRFLRERAVGLVLSYVSKHGASQLRRKLIEIVTLPFGRAFLRALQRDLVILVPLSRASRSAEIAIQ